jgi:hypothetical protein
MLIIRHFFWALTSSFKRRDSKMFKVMMNGVTDGIKVYKESKCL